jgi:hypothetical protein
MLFSAGSRYKSLLRFVPTFILLIVPEAVKNADMFLLISKIILDFLATFSIWQGTLASRACREAPLVCYLRGVFFLNDLAVKGLEAPWREHRCRNDFGQARQS